MAIVHAFVSAKDDGGDATLVRPSNWNADHTIEAGTILPAVTLGGAITAGGQAITGLALVSFQTGANWYDHYIASAVDNSHIAISGGTDTTGAYLVLYGKSEGTHPGKFILSTPNASLTYRERLNITGAVDTAVATWSNITHTNIQITGAANAFGDVVLATGGGATVDDVITALQNLGLVTQS